MRVLDFDCEARPLSWISSDYVSKEITAIAWAWTDQPEDVTCLMLGECDLPYMLTRFSEAYAQADLVTGHFIRGFDLPLMNGMLTECQLPVLGDKLTHDTKLDYVLASGVSKSQESQAAMLGLEHEKEKMDQAKWRKANRLMPEGLVETRRRVTGDVRQHMEMRARLLALNYLTPPKVWKGGTAKAESYQP